MLSVAKLQMAIFLICFINWTIDIDVTKLATILCFFYSQMNYLFLRIVNCVQLSIHCYWLWFVVLKLFPLMQQCPQIEFHFFFMFSSLLLFIFILFFSSTVAFILFFSKKWIGKEKSILKWKLAALDSRQNHLMNMRKKNAKGVMFFFHSIHLFLYGEWKKKCYLTKTEGGGGGERGKKFFQ